MAAIPLGASLLSLGSADLADSSVLLPLATSARESSTGSIQRRMSDHMDLKTKKRTGVRKRLTNVF